jgi:general secretion pathway protein N
MIRSATAFGCALGVFVFAAPATLVAAPATAIEPPLAATISAAPSSDLGVIKLENTKTEAARSGNPLWAVPLSTLSVTRERPIFSPSRRPPPPPVVVPPVVVARPPPPPPPKPVVPERPALVLVGTVANEGEGIGVFLDQATMNIIRLRTGEGHAGWILLSVKAREATLQNPRNTVTLALPAPTETNNVTNPEL